MLRKEMGGQERIRWAGVTLVVLFSIFPFISY
jgi:hypothetical protein